MKEKLAALQRLRPNCEFYLIGENMQDVVWVNPSNTTTPTDSEIDACVAQMAQDVINDKLKIEAAKLAAQQKLAALGITADDLVALGL